MELFEYHEECTFSTVKGHSAQVRWGSKPDGVCLVVGACNRGHRPEDNTTGDVICTTENLRLSTDASRAAVKMAASGEAAASAEVRDCQLFWEVC